MRRSRTRAVAASIRVANAGRFSERRFGCGSSSHVAVGAFPKHHRISSNAVAWVEQDVVDWMRDKASARRGPVVSPAVIKAIEPAERSPVNAPKGPHGAGRSALTRATRRPR